MTEISVIIACLNGAATLAEALDSLAARFDLTALNPDWTLAERPHAPDRLAVLPFEPFCPVAGGATLGFHRRVFEAVGDFDPGFAAQEDTDFCIRAHRKGFAIRLVPDAVYNYRFRDTPETIYRQAYAYSRAEALLRRRHMAEPRFLAPRPWLSLASRSARLSAEWLKARALRRERSLLERARFNRRLGTAMGSLAGSLAYRVAPRIPGGAPAAGRPLLQPLLRRLYGSTFAVATDERLMALTFDDGPDPEHTPRLLEVLARHGAKATFFMVGARAARHPELVARVAAEGHEIGNHGWDHPSLPALPSAAVAGQLERTRAVLAPHGQALMRPPYGHQDLRTHRIARRLGYRPVFWSITGEDWRGHDAATIAGHILERAAPGSIVLLHDSLFAWEEAAFRDRSACFAAVETLLERLPGYRFVTVSELLRRGAARQRYWVQLPDRADMARLRLAEGSAAR